MVEPPYGMKIQPVCLHGVRTFSACFGGESVSKYACHAGGAARRTWAPHLRLGDTRSKPAGSGQQRVATLRFFYTKPVKRRYLRKDAWPFCPRTFWVAFWHAVCCRMACEAITVRRGVYILLAVFLVQLSGLRALCVPSQRQTHACCPISTKTTPNSSSLPACCVNSILNFQGSITESRSSDRPSEYTAQPAAVSVPSAAPLVALSKPVRQRVLPSISPP